MKFIVENWFVIVAIAAVGGSIGYAIYSFVKMPSDKQLNKVREWLLYAVTKAEKELGAGTGKLKLRYVYDMFVARFEWLAKVITFDMFSMMVDEALEQMRTMLDSNEAVQKLIAKERSYYRYEDGKRVKHTVTPVLGEKAAHNGKVVYSLDFEVTPHQLRHTYITNLIHASVDPKTVQYLAGHESSKITMDIYAKVKYNRPDELVRSMNCAFASWDAAQ